MSNQTASQTPGQKLQSVLDTSSASGRIVRMIQSLPTRRSEWMLLWVELNEPILAPKGAVLLPTFLVVADGRGVPIAPPELVAEVDQHRAENLLSSLFDQQGRPERLVVANCPEWDMDSWREFAEEYDIELRFQDTPVESLPRLLESATTVLGRGENAEQLSASLLESALRVRSPRRREAYLRKCLELAPGNAAARVELADLEFSLGQWKKCGQNYAEAMRIEEPRWAGQNPQWWTDSATRTFLRSLYGQGMTLWHQGNHLKAAASFARLLQINPQDHQGVRFYLPMLYLLAEHYEEAKEFFRHYEKNYPGDFPDPAFHFGWGLSLYLEGDEARAKEKYRLGILRNNYLAPALLEEPEPPTQVWFPNDRSEPTYAAEFVESYAVLWDREAGSLRLVREAWEEAQEAVAAILACRRKIFDFQDQRYDPQYKKHWEELIEEEARLSGGGSLP